MRIPAFYTRYFIIIPENAFPIFFLVFGKKFIVGKVFPDSEQYFIIFEFIRKSGRFDKEAPDRRDDIEYSSIFSFGIFC